MNPLTTKQRSRSFLLLVLIFIIIAPLILLYSFGYRLDSSYTLQKTGGVFIHSDIANSSVFIDGKYFKNSGIFIRNTLIQNLTPNKKYKIKVQKNGYQSWIKDMAVYPSIVSEGRVLLLPNKFETREILPYIDPQFGATTTPPTKSKIKPTNAEYMDAFELFASSTKKIKKPNTVVASTTVATSVVSVQKSELELFFESIGIEEYETLPNLIVNGKEVSWIENGNITLEWMSDLSTIPYYYCDGKERKCSKEITLDWQNDILRFAYLPGRNDVWIVLVPDGIYAVEVDGRTARNIQKIYEEKNVDFRLTKNDRLLVKQDKEIFEVTI